MILLDTHVWIWWVHGLRNRMGDCIKVLDALGNGEVGVSAVSLWEVALLTKHGKIEISQPFSDWLEKARAGSQISILPLLPETAVAAALLPGELHRDPADRFLIAEARSRNCLFVTEYREILRYDGVRAVCCSDLEHALRP